MPSKPPSKEAEPTNQNAQPSSENTTTTTNKNNGNQPSLLSRIQNSASSLIQDSLTKPSGATLSSDLAHVLDNGNKASSSASFSASTYSGQTWRSNGLENGSSSSARGLQDDYASGMSEGFRSFQPNSARGFDTSEFDSFQDTGGFFHTQGQDDFIPETSNKGKGKSREQPYDSNIEHGQDMNLDINEDDYESSHFSAYEMAWINASRLGTVYRSAESTPSKRLSQDSQSDINTSTPLAQYKDKNQNENDGAEVVTLLSDPSFQPGLTTQYDDNQHHYDGMKTFDTHESSFGPGSGLGFGLDFDDDPLDKEGFPHTLTADLQPGEIKILDLFRRQQPSYQHNTHQTHQTTQNQEGRKKRITAYSLVPDIDSFLSASTANNIKGGIGMEDDDALRNEVIANLIGAEEWLHVDERYNDEVWGYLRPAVEAAAAEIKEKEQSSRDEGDGDGPAVKRLKMILRHMARL